MEFWRPTSCTLKREYVRHVGDAVSSELTKCACFFRQSYSVTAPACMQVVHEPGGLLTRDDVRSPSATRDAQSPKGMLALEPPDFPDFPDFPGAEGNMKLLQVYS